MQPFTTPSIRLILWQIKRLLTVTPWPCRCTYRGRKRSKRHDRCPGSCQLPVIHRGGLFAESAKADPDGFWGGDTGGGRRMGRRLCGRFPGSTRSEEHTSEL